MTVPEDIKDLYNKVEEVRNQVALSQVSVIKEISDLKLDISEKLSKEFRALPCGMHEEKFKGLYLGNKLLWAVVVVIIASIIALKTTY